MLYEQAHPTREFKARVRGTLRCFWKMSHPIGT
jgi:hypothetical protein